MADDETLDPAPGSTLSARALFEARTVLVYGEVDTRLARTVSSELLALASTPGAPIRILVHSQGGHVEAADTIYDLIRAVAPDARVVGTGWVASAGALIYAAAQREHRYALPNTRFLLHQPRGGVSGRASHIEIEATQIARMRARLDRIFAEATGQPIERVARDTERDHWMDAQEARVYGLVHRVIERLDELPRG